MTRRAMLHEMTRGVVFDLDGTLLATEVLLDEINAEVLGRHRLPLTEAVRIELMGRTRADCDRILAEVLGERASLAEVSREREALLRSRLPRVGLMPGVMELVTYLAERAIPMAIATSSTSEALRLKLAAHPALAQHMQVVVCSDHPAVLSPKPSPDVFLAAAAGLGIDPHECVAFEDAPAGVLAAVAAGMRVVAVPHPSASHLPVFGQAHLMVSSLAAFDPSWL